MSLNLWGLEDNMSCLSQSAAYTGRRADEKHSSLWVPTSDPSSSTKATTQVTYWFQLIQRANTAHPHVRELHGNPALWGDASHSALSKLVVHDLTPKAQAAIDASDHSQHCHEAPHFRVLRVGKVVL